MTSTPAEARVRLSKIAGRYLIFDSEAAAFLRRNEGINGTLTGTAPQQPTQNIFLGLPIELRPEEAEALIHKDVAYLVDDVAAHQDVLRNPNLEARKAYLDSLKSRKRTAHKVFAEQSAKKAAEVARKHGVSRSKGSRHASTSTNDDDLFLSDQPESTEPHTDALVKSLAVTPTSSGALLARQTELTHMAQKPSAGHLCRFLLHSGYFMTPGLRFGSKYSVYPGDPLRFHAHFMANPYHWDEEIPILDIVAGGRLATAVKKAFLIGGQEPGLEGSPDGPVRSFSLEWAAM